jgi:phosphatidylglycerophosphatase A
MTFQNRTILFLATGCGSGYVPGAPGTAGSLVGLVPAFVLSTMTPVAAGSAWLCFAIASAWISDRAEKRIGRKDPGIIVIDEIAGITVTLLWMPFTFPVVSAGFLLFRIMDILKPFPIRWLESRVPGGVGVVIDDVAAGIFSHILLRVIQGCMP